MSAGFNGAERLLAGHDAAQVAIECAGQRSTYGELRERVARAAGAWQRRGLRSGDRVAIKLDDGIDWAVAWLGVVWAGGVAVGVNPRVGDADWRTMLDEARFDAVVAAGDDAVPAAWRSRLVLLADARREWDAAPALAAVPLAPEAPALWVHSSGTSGRPKAVVHAHRALDAVARIAHERLGIGPHDRVLASSRLFFTYPLVNALLAGLRLGATVVIDPQWPTAASFAAAIECSDPSVVYSVPALYRNLLHEGHGGVLRRVRLAVSAGEALPARLHDALVAASGVAVADGYGASETLTLVLTALPGDDGLQPSPGVDVQPLDAAAAAAGAPTRLAFRTATLATGYLGVAAEGAFADGAFVPADLFVRTPGGGWRFAGREDSLVKVAGRWVDLADLEERLGAGLPGLREAALAVVDDADGVAALAFFYAGEDSSAQRALLTARIAALPPHQRPARLQRLPALPRTASGKLLRRQLAGHLAAKAA